MRIAKAFGLVLLMTISFVAGVVVSQRWLPTMSSSVSETAPARYQCAMHPQIVQDHPGLCPICHMELQRVVESAPLAAAPSKILFYRHPMRPDVTSPVPAKDEMGMDYVPVREEDLATEGASQVPGHAPFTLSTERQQLIGVKRARIERRPLEIEIRATGTVAYDPMLYQAIADYREALQSRSAIRDSIVPEAREGARAIVGSAGLRLRQMGISEQQLREIAEGGSPPTNLLLPGKSVWVYAQIHEYQTDLVKAGQAVEISSVALPGRTFAAKIVAVDPMLTSSTRTLRVRALVQTPDASLRPETFVDVKIRVPLGEKVAVPEDAVLDTGAHQIVFVVQGDGYFEPRDIELGRQTGDYYEVLSGLEAGEEIVTSANFLIDSESRFRAAVAAFSRASKAEAK